jgi:hypothetical protein
MGNDEWGRWDLRGSMGYADFAAGRSERGLKDVETPFSDGILNEVLLEETASAGCDRIRTFGKVYHSPC